MVPRYLQPEIFVKVQHPLLFPQRAYHSDAGADLRSNSNLIVVPNQTVRVDTGVAVKIPLGFVGLIFSRSSQGVIRVSLANAVGVIDSDYRGNIKLLLTNEGTENYEIHGYDTKVAQLVIVPIILPVFVEPDANTPWNETQRGVNGFGSTN